MSNHTSLPDSITALTEKRARELKLYNFFRPQSERRTTYGQLRSLGVSKSQADRVRDWSDGHIETFIENHLKDFPGGATG